MTLEHRHDTPSQRFSGGRQVQSPCPLIVRIGPADDKIVGVEMPTGNPLLIELDATLKPKSARYLDAARATELPALPA